MNRGDGLLLVARPVEVGHAHTAKSNCGGLQTLRAEAAQLDGGGTHMNSCNWCVHGTITEQILRNASNASWYGWSGGVTHGAEKLVNTWHARGSLRAWH